jgi:hypothetical protein
MFLKNINKYQKISKNIKNYQKISKRIKEIPSPDQFFYNFFRAYRLSIDRLPKFFIYFFLKVHLKISLNPKFQKFWGHSLILNSNMKLQGELFKRVKTFENKRKEAF